MLTARRDRPNYKTTQTLPRIVEKKSFITHEAPGRYFVFAQQPVSNEAVTPLMDVAPDGLAIGTKTSSRVRFSPSVEAREGMGSGNSSFRENNRPAIDSVPGPQPTGPATHTVPVPNCAGVANLPPPATQPQRTKR